MVVKLRKIQIESLSLLIVRVNFLKDRQFYPESVSGNTYYKEIHDLLIVNGRKRSHPLRLKTMEKSVHSKRKEN